MNRKKVILIVLMFILVCGAGAFLVYKYWPRPKADITVSNVCEGDCFKVITWGYTTATYERELGITGFRAGCDSDPEGCVATEYKNFVDGKTAGNKVYISMTNDPAKVADYALKYSQSSVGKDWLAEVGIDDFVGQLKKWQDAGINTAEVMNSVTTNIKSVNPDLKFGITFYETYFGNPAISEQNLPLDVRQKIDFVHLYLIYRSDGPNYASYVEQAKTLFPNAKIIAGSYNYDRIDAYACKQAPYGVNYENGILKQAVKCTTDQEISFFEQTLRIQVDMLSKGEIYAIEFYPGFFADPATWSAWNMSKACLPERKAECIQVTAEMENSTIGILNQDRVIPTSVKDQSNSAVTNYQDQTFPDQTSQNFDDSSEVAVNNTSNENSQNNSSSNSTAPPTQEQSTQDTSNEDLTTSGPDITQSILLSLFATIFTMLLIWSRAQSRKEKDRFPY